MKQAPRSHRCLALLEQPVSIEQPVDIVDLLLRGYEMIDRLRVVLVLA